MSRARTSIIYKVKSRPSNECIEATRPDSEKKENASRADLAGFDFERLGVNWLLIKEGFPEA